MGVQAMDGFAELMKELERTERVVTNEQTVKEVTMAGANVVVPEAKKNLQKYGMRSIEKSIGAEFDSGEKVAVVGWGGDMNKTASAHGFLGPWFENGTAFRRTKGKSKKLKKARKAHSTGVLRARPHIKPAYQDNKERIAGAMISKIREKI